MADIITIGKTKDTGSGSKLKTGGMRRTYNTKKKKSPKSFRKANNKYVAGK